MRKERLMKKLLKLKERAKNLDERAAKSTDEAEIARLTEERSNLNDEIEDIEAEIKECEEEERNTAPADAEVRNGNITASFTQTAPAQQRSENVLESVEYREAFRQLWTNGTPINTNLLKRARSYVNSLPEEQRSGTPINTSNTSAVIPLTIMREVINTVRTPYGGIYDRVRKTSVAGAVEYPIGEFEASFNWVTESTASPEQDIGAVATISFGYFEAELRIAQTFLSALLSLDAFEREVSTVIARAYRKFMDNAIVNADGKCKITGLAAATTTSVSMTAAQMADWTQWQKRFFAGLTPGYEDGVFIFARSTAVKYLKTMADGNNRPLFYEATGGKIGDGDRIDDTGYFFGREILMTVPAIVADFDTASSSDVIGYFFQPDSFVLNENFGFTVDRYYNYEKRKWITVATVVVDGKPINSTGFVKIVKA